jgi:CheY-like chemotaxis protein/nitrogen-specific signal transduction histidine kinase
VEQEREELRRERIARAAAEAANKSKDEFLTVLSHELRNPVGVIVYALAVLDASKELDPARMPQLNQARSVIRRQTQVLARLLDDLLDIARISNRRIELHLQHVDVRSIVRQAVETERHRIEQKRQQVTLRLGDDPVIVAGDAIRLHQVVGNIVNNAWKYTKVGGTIDVAVATENAWATVRVLDNGAGIPPDRLEAVFELFTQANPSLARTEGGLGIGLTLVRHLVELHGGEVQARSAGLGKGAEFIVRLPLASEASQRADSPAPAAPTPRRILVVDDSTDGREMLSMALRMSGHEVFDAATGHEGIEMARRYTPAIVLVDIDLPDIDGYELARRIRQTSGKGVRLIALTGYSRPEDRGRAEQAGFDAHAVKPIGPSRLAELLGG